jgi:hypothetical protein
MSKFLLNLLVQNSKVCQKFRFQIKYERILFLEIWPSYGHLPSSPTDPLSPSPLGLGLPVGPAGRRPLSLLKWLEHSPLITSHHPANPLPKQVIMELHYAATSPSMAGRFHSSPRPYKNCPSTPPPSHRPGVLPLSFPLLLSSTTITAVAKHDAAGETPLHRLPTRGDPVVELASPSFPTPALGRSSRAPERPEAELR